jgi:hypothetical protein
MSPKQAAVRERRPCRCSKWGSRFVGAANGYERASGMRPSTPPSSAINRLRLTRSDADSMVSLGGWLTTVTGRICLGLLRARVTRGEQPLMHLADRIVSPTDDSGAENEALNLRLVRTRTPRRPADVEPGTTNSRVAKHGLVHPHDPAKSFGVDANVISTMRPLLTVNATAT